MNAKAGHSGRREDVARLTDIINIGPSVAADLNRIGIHAPRQLVQRDPWELYLQICERDRCYQDPCLLDVLWSAVDYMNGNRPRPWWEFTTRRKARYSAALAEVKSQYLVASAAPRNKKRRVATTRR